MKDFKLPPYGCALFLKNSLQAAPITAPITAPPFGCNPQGKELVPVETGQSNDITINKTYNFQLDLEFNITGINPKIMVKSANYIDEK
jgi:hypothetical protein